MHAGDIIGGGLRQDRVRRLGATLLYLWFTGSSITGRIVRPKVRCDATWGYGIDSNLRSKLDREGTNKGLNCTLGRAIQSELRLAAKGGN